MDSLALADRSRVEELARYGVTTDTHRADLEPLVRLAAHIAGVPMASIDLLDATAQHQVAVTGFERVYAGREDALCNVTIAEDEPVVVPDTRADPRFCDNPYVDGRLAAVRFYAGFQLRSPGGTTIGTLCVLDEEPGLLTEDRQAALLILAEQVVMALELDRRGGELAATIDRLRETQAHLQRSNDRLAAFAGQVSHDLRSPLAAMTMSLGLIEEQLRSPDVPLAEMCPLLGRAVGAVDRMGALIDDLLTYARAGSDLEQQAVDVTKVAREALEDLSAYTNDAVIAIGPMPTVQADPVQLHAVLLNLLSNALKFTREGEHPVIEVSALLRENRWRISVADHGIGLPDLHRERLFEEFERVHAEIEGTGIGLATVRRVINAHGGRFGAEDTPGGGATFWVEFDAA